MNKNIPNTKKRLHLLSFKRLFWRIFMFFWLASLTIMAATTYVIIEKFEATQFVQRHHTSLQEQANRIIRQHESGKLSRHKQLNNKRHHAKRTLLMSIYDEEKILIFGHRNRWLKDKASTHLQVNSGSGKLYHVYSAAPRAPMFFRKALQRFNTVQFVFIFILATLVSALLSWSISRPLKKLGDFSRQYAQGNNLTSLDAKLLSRGDEIGALAGDIDYMIKQIENTLNAKQQLLHNVSHELRAPLARLQASAALIEQQGENNLLTENIHNECRHIDRLIQQILDYSRLNTLQEDKQPLELVGLIENILGNLTLEYPDNKFITAHDKTTILIIGHKLSMHSALENIIRNACKHTPKGTQINIDVRSTNTEVIISVRDHGKGVAPEDLEKLLQPFYRAGNEMHTDGFGLGLSIANQAITNQGGKLSITNHPDGGLLVECCFSCPQ